MKFFASLSVTLEVDFIDEWIFLYDPKCQQNDPISLFFERFVNQHWTGTLRVE